MCAGATAWREMSPAQKAPRKKLADASSLQYQQKKSAATPADAAVRQIRSGGAAGGGGAAFLPNGN